MNTLTKHGKGRPAQIQKLILFGALTMIMAAGCAGQGPGLRADPGPAGVEPAPPGGATEGRVTLRHLENFQLCADRNPEGLAGRSRLEIEVGIDPAGRVLQSRVTASAPGDEGLAACVARALTWIEFDRAVGTYRHYRLGLGRDGDGRVLVDLTDLDAPVEAQAGAADPRRAGISAELAEALDGVAGRD